MAKTNPKRIPRTQADVDKAFQEGMNTGSDILCNIFLQVLLDKHNATQEELDIFAKEVNDMCEAINEGRISYADISCVLRDEYGFKMTPLKRRMKI